MSWYREANKANNQSYSAPTVSEQKLDSSGNYVSPAPEGSAAADGSPHVKPLVNSPVT